MTRRVVVTGVGLVCALGIGTEESWKNLVAGCSGVKRITHFDIAEFDCKIAGEIKDFDPFQWIEKKELKKMAQEYAVLARWLERRQHGPADEMQGPELPFKE